MGVFVRFVSRSFCSSGSGQSLTTDWASAQGLAPGASLTAGRCLRRAFFFFPFFLNTTENCWEGIAHALSCGYRCVTGGCNGGLECARCVFAFRSVPSVLLVPNA